MQTLLVSEPTRKRKPKAKKEIISLTIRIAPEVKKSLSDAAQKYSRSDNLQAEFSLKVAYLFASGIKLDNLSDADINQKFDEMVNEIETDD